MKMSEIKKNRNLRVNPLNKINQTKCLIRMNSSFRIKWDLIVMACAIWNCLSIPLELSFQPDIAKTIGWMVFNG
jgi:hypothetical protein